MKKVKTAPVKTNPRPIRETEKKAVSGGPKLRNP